MRLAVVAANGKAGKLIVEEAVKRGIDVTAIVREENKTIAQTYMKLIESNKIYICIHLLFFLH